jgi:prepilin-type N-terminal cleavage/methylation domain-containing protein
MKKNLEKGFTLIEILVVIGIIAVLAAIVIVAINPAKQFAQARDTQRTSNVESILNAIGQRIADNKGVFAGSFSSGTYNCGPLPLSTTGSSTVTTDNTALTPGALGCLVPTYISALPVDPAWQTGIDPANSTLYTVVQDSTSGRITVCAPRSAQENAIPDATTTCITR